jgi:hypothetical protein
MLRSAGQSTDAGMESAASEAYTHVAQSRRYEERERRRSSTQRMPANVSWPPYKGSGESGSGCGSTGGTSESSPAVAD